DHQTQKTESVRVEPSIFETWGGRGFQELMADYARSLVESALIETNGNIGQAAKRLGIRRSSIDYRIRSLGIDIDRTRGPQKTKH
ncbi:MAG: helix-turn-helix domain-containing protein, partial [Myxococcota bacterium]